MVEWFFYYKQLEQIDCLILLEMIASFVFFIKAKGRPKNLPFTNDTFSNVFIDILLHNQFP